MSSGVGSSNQLAALYSFSVSAAKTLSTEEESSIVIIKVMSPEFISDCNLHCNAYGVEVILQLKCWNFIR